MVAKLPFEPISWIRGLSHRGLNGEDYTGKDFSIPLQSSADKIDRFAARCRLLVLVPVHPLYHVDPPEPSEDPWRRALESCEQNGQRILHAAKHQQLQIGSNASQASQSACSFSAN